MKNIIGTKIGMTRVYDDVGKLVPVTIIKVDKCWVVGLKTKEKDGYDSIQLGLDIKKDKKVTKPYRGLFKNINNGECPLYVREFRGSEDSLALGQEFNVDIFEKGEYIDITSLSKGKGFAGTIKRHGFGGLSHSHGHGEYRRAPGSIGASSYPSRVFKGQRMAGRCGGDNVTVQKLEIVDVKPEERLLLVKGSCAGINGSLLKIKQTVKFLKKKKERKVTASEVKLNKKR